MIEIMMKTNDNSEDNYKIKNKWYLKNIFKIREDINNLLF